MFAPFIHPFPVFLFFAVSSPEPPSDPSARRPSVSLAAATALVVGTMVGTGIFTSLGFQIAAAPSAFPILLLWVAGGVLAFCGAVNYAELTAAFPRSGGEYHLLGRVYHPSLGFLSGWVSLTAGFPAPVAVSALLFGHYATSAAGWTAEWARPLACAAIVLVTAVHLVSVKASGRMQILSTSLKVALIAGLAVAGFAVKDPQPVSFAPKAGDGALIASNAWVVSLIFVLYAYSGWNAACYIAGEVRDPQRSIPRALLLGTGLVLALYLALNAAFLYSAPMEEMKGRRQVAFVAAEHIFGPAGGRVAAGIIALALVSSISAMLWAGPRVVQVMGRDYPLLSPLAKTWRGGSPRVGILLQAGLALLLALAANVEQIVAGMELCLQLVLLLTVWGVLHLRLRKPDLPRPYRAWGYPWTTLLFCAAMAFVLAYILKERQRESIMGLSNLGTGLVLYFFAARSRSGGNPVHAG